MGLISCAKPSKFSATAPNSQIELKPTKTERKASRHGNSIINLKQIQRLEGLKQDKFLTQKIFPRLSDNIHYEIFKNLNSRDLLKIKEINLGGYQLTTNHHLRGKMIKNYFSYLKPMLDLSEKSSNVEKNIKIVKLIYQQTEKEYLDFRTMQIQDQGAIQFARIFMHIPETKELNLAMNQIGESGMKSLAGKLKYLPNLQTINLNFNSIGDIGIQAFANNLNYIPNLHTLEMHINKFGIGAKALYTNLKFVPNLRILRLGGNEITPDLKQLIREYANQHRIIIQI